MIDYSHLNALESRLHNEQVRLGQSPNIGTWNARLVIVQGIEREIASERQFLGLPATLECAILNDDELLAALQA
jgi:hypothetical protein